MRFGGLTAGLVVALVAGVTCSCDRFRGTVDDDAPGEQRTDEQNAKTGDDDASLPAPPDGIDGPALPREGGDYSPSLARVVEENPDVETLEQVESCGECHETAVEQWRDSTHAFASFDNPMYRFVFEDFVEAEGRERGRHCAGCHDPVPMVAGEISSRIDPSSRRAHLGVTCNTCHGVVDATPDGNGSYTLTTRDVPIPEQGDPDSLEAHRERVGLDDVDTDRMCASCHRGFLSESTGHEAFIFGFDEYRPWRRSGWNGNRATRVDEPVPDRSCVDCHMPENPASGDPSHRFPGGHSAMAEMLDADRQLEAVEEMLTGAATIDVAAVGVRGERFPTEGEELSATPGAALWFDVVVRNVAGGHRLPGGQRDLRDTWFEVVVRTAEGEVVAEAGRDHRESGSDMSAHRLRKLVLTDRAETERTHSVAHFRTKAFDRTVGPRDAELTRYAWRLPESLEGGDFPLTVEARLQHRRLSKVFYEASCEAASTDRGEAFLDGAERVHGRRPSPCVDQPVVEMASDTAELGPSGFRPGGGTSDWRRWFERGLALQSHLSERLDEAIDSFDRARRALEEAELPRAERRHRRGMILAAEARVFARQRRHREAVEQYDRAEELVGEHPAIYVGRGDAYANVWKYEEAVEQYRRAAELVDDDRVWRKLAVAQGSLGRHTASLQAAQRGLALEPRQSGLLRAQMLALRNLDVPEAWRSRASEAFGRFKRDTEAPELRATCSDRSEICELERLPIHTHELESVTRRK